MSVGQPAVVLYDASDNPMAVSNGAVVGSTKALLIAGSDGTNARILSVDASGRVDLQSAGATGAAVPSRAVLLGGKDSSGNLQALLATAGGVLIQGDLKQLAASAGGGIRTKMGQITTASISAVIMNNAPTGEGTAGAQVQIRSASASDTAAGTGARTAKLTLYDSSMNGPYFETLTLNGTTNVLTAGTNYQYCESVEVMTVGSNGSNVGALTIDTVVGALILKTVAIGDNRDFVGAGYIPATATAGYVTGIIASVKEARADIDIRWRLLTNLTGPNTYLTRILSIVNTQSVVYVSFETPLYVPPGSRIAMWASSPGSVSITPYATLCYYWV